MELVVSRDIHVEEIDGEAIVLDRSGGVLHHVSGEAFEALSLVRLGIDDANVPAHLKPSMAELIDAGVVTPSDSSRRKLLKTAGAGLAGGALITVGPRRPPPQRADLSPWRSTSRGNRPLTSSAPPVVPQRAVARPFHPHRDSGRDLSSRHDHFWWSLGWDTKRVHPPVLIDRMYQSGVGRVLEHASPRWATDFRHHDRLGCNAFCRRLAGARWHGQRQLGVRTGPAV